MIDLKALRISARSDELSLAFSSGAKSLTGIALVDCSQLIPSPMTKYPKREKIVVLLA